MFASEWQRSADSDVHGLLKLDGVNPPESSFNLDYAADGSSVRMALWFSSETTAVGRALRPMIGIAAVAAVVGMAAGTAPVGAMAQVRPPTTSVEDVARLIIEAPRLFGGQLSSDGSRVLYVVKRASITDNQIVAELLVQRIEHDGVPAEVPIVIARAARPRGDYAFGERWCPDGTCITYRAPTSSVETGGTPETLMRYDFRASRATLVPVRDEASNTSEEGGRPRIASIGPDYKWSPSGRAIAFTAPLGAASRLTPVVGVRVTAALLQRGLSFATSPIRGLFILNPESGRLQQLSPNNLNVKTFDWAPNEQAVVVDAEMEDDAAEAWDRRDLFLIDRATRGVRPLVRQPGQDTDPVWSPNGEWIAFNTTFGVTNDDQSVALVPAAGGPIVRLVAHDGDPAAGHGKAWMPDSLGFYFASLHRMTVQFYRADVATGRITSLPVDEEGGIQEFSVSPDGRWLVLVRSTVTVPEELYLRRLPDGSLKQVTRISPGLPLSSLVKVERVEWPSLDGRFTVHGLLLTPRTAETVESAARVAAPTVPLPTLVYVEGGPVMVEAGFAIRRTGAGVGVLSLATQGYAVLVPNTRGRPGYGRAFKKGIRDGESYARLPYGDMVAGVDYLIRRGISDPTRLGIWGHSYGAFLTSYAVTQTHRFRASVSYEGPARLVNYPMEALPGTSRDANMREQFGVRSNPFGPEEMARLIAESPAFNMHCVATPMLLLTGERSGLAKDAGVVFSALRRFGIPVELILYDEGHGFTLPTAQVDFVARIAAWFDYWVRDVPYVDSALGVDYNAWRAAHPRPASFSTPCASSGGSH